ncbi:MAG: CoA transferase [Alphaproteobacteria bacterium]|nr:CoA transferase [Alphaproteobacteria bacterium]MDP6254307.1 CoA transferase [Alphaproteobacteria bacterium]MDP7054903.1 CoA transferase [Alphaproteobacteria bacterium]MDP7227817.1 CoA transferase [Alphaproteobacteria bacterium]MDP7461946.1 CoA transferase [Alphaproteobacteria bacterium]
MSQVLDGVRVLDFGRYIAGPCCGMMLGDLGADVIRIEKIDGSEDRYTTPIGEGAEGEECVGSGYLHLNRNKRGLTLNPMKPEGREIVKKLVATADVVIANLPTETLTAMGLDYESLRAVKEDIILTTVSAFTSVGPYKDRVGFDGVAAAMSGMMHLSGYEDEPMKAHTPWVDFGTASAATIGTLAALLHKRATGEGQRVEGSLLGTALLFNNAGLIEQAMIGADRVGSGNRGQTSAPSDAFKCSDDKWIIVQVVGQTLFNRWIDLMGDGDYWLKDPKFKDDLLRGDNGVEISARMQKWCSERTREEAIATLAEARIPCGHVYKPADTLKDPQVLQGDFLQEVDYPGTPSPAPMSKLHVRFSKTPADTIRMRAPTLGEHTDEVMHELGYDDATIAELREKRVV